MFAEIIKLRPDWAGTKITNDEGKEAGYNHEDGAIRIIMTASATDKADLQQHAYTKRAKKRLEKRFKDPDDELKIVIVRDMPLKNLAIELLEKLLKDEIRGRMSGNVVQEKAYTDRLIETLRRYHNRSIETAQVIEEMIAMAKDFQERLKRDEELGLNPDELAFYDALANNASAVRELGDVTLKKIAVELTEKLRSSTTVDWQHRESVRAKLRNLIRRLLRKYKYPPDEAPAAIKLIMLQAETLAETWG